MYNRKTSEVVVSSSPRCFEMKFGREKTLASSDDDKSIRTNHQNWITGSQTRRRKGSRMQQTDDSARERTKGAQPRPRASD